MRSASNPRSRSRHDCIKADARRIDGKMPSSASREDDVPCNGLDSVKGRG